MKDLESSIGKGLYGGSSSCRITAKSLETTTDRLGRYKFAFHAEGICSPPGGQLVLGCYDKRMDKHSYCPEHSATMLTTIAGIQLPLSHCYTSSSLDADANFFDFYVSPVEAYYEDLLSEGWDTAETVTITMTGLTRLTTQCLPGISPFS